MISRPTHPTLSTELDGGRLFDKPTGKGTLAVEMERQTNKIRIRSF
jgi:hypothetical protein